METFKIIYTVLGGLGIFFYGMKSMSEALQSLGGDVIKKTIATLTTNRFSAVLVGIVVTCLVQSSSVSTVMTIGLVNAGLMNLTQAIGIIFGANVGTTITGWIISIKVGKYGLLFIGAGIFPMLFSLSTKYRQLGRVLFGIGMIFFGLSLMSDAFKPLRTMPEFLDMISYFSGQHYGSYIASIVTGCLLTMIVQSSSAMLGITMALAMTGVIQFHTAAALVMGENVGTTITALLASVGGNINARRASRAHAIFNILGVLAIFSFFPLYVQFIDYIVPGDPNAVNSAGEYFNIAVHIATGHTVFNVTATILFLPFLNKLAKFVIEITPDKKGKGPNHFIMLGEAKDMVPATALAQVRAENDKLIDIVNRMYSLTHDYINFKVEDRKKALEKISHYEQVVDNIQKEVTLFLVKLMSVPMTEEESREAQMHVKVADEIESITDYMEKLSQYMGKLDEKELFCQESKDEFYKYFADVKKYYEDTTRKFLAFEESQLNESKKISDNLKEVADQIRRNHVARLKEGEVSPYSALVYSDMIVALRKIRSHTENISVAHNTIG